MPDSSAVSRSTSSPDHWKSQHEGRLSALLDVVQQAGQRTLDYFQTSHFKVERKSDHSPVTIADQEAERLVRKFVEQHFPKDDLLGEEYGKQGNQDAPYRWIVDPIDGTKSFIAGVPLYSTLIGLEHQGEVIGGAILIPALREIAIAAVGQGTWWRRGDAPWQLCHVSSRQQLSDAVFVTSQVDSFAAQNAPEAYDRLQQSCWITRTWGDAYGYLLVATGRADVMVDPIVNPWDVAAVLPVVREAGGAFTDWTGKVTIAGRNAVGTNGLLHDEVLSMLQH